MGLTILAFRRLLHDAKMHSLFHHTLTYLQDFVLADLFLTKKEKKKNINDGLTYGTKGIVIIEKKRRKKM